MVANEIVDPASVGMVKTKKGGWFFPSELDPVDVQRNDMIVYLAGRAEALQNELEVFKKMCEEELMAHVALSNGDEVDSPQDMTGTYESLDGRIIMEVEYAPVYHATESIVKLKTLLRSALEELSGKIDKTGLAVVRKVLKIDRNIVDMRQLERLSSLGGAFLTSESWREAVQLVPSCAKIVRYHPYYRFYAVSADGERTPVMRNFSAIKITERDYDE